jgi:hypothetical protein
MRLVLLIALAAATAGQAAAADAPASLPGARAEPPVCTTTTTVVRRGDVVLSTTSSTKCEDASSAQGGFHPSAILAAPRAVAAAPAALFGSLAFGNGEELTLRNAAADWRVIDERSEQVCHLVLNARSAPSGFAARSVGCSGALAGASAWTFNDGAVDVAGKDGALIVRLSGDRTRLAGSTVDGASLQLQR